MEKNLKVNFKYSGISTRELLEYSKEVEQIHAGFKTDKAKEKEPIGWIELPTQFNKKEYEKIKKISSKIKKDSDVLIVIGIGGSYLGARAIIEALTDKYKKDMRTEVIYVGNNLNADYINEILDYVSDKEISLNIISKSGKTIEPAIAFRIFRNLMENKYGIDEAKKRIYVTTTKGKGALYKIAVQEKYTKLYIPDDIGGRYSVLTPVGLLPIAVAGIDIDKIMEGAKNAQEEYYSPNLKYNDCYKYAVIRNILYKKAKNIEILATYNPKLFYFQEWWKQLFAESEGKNKSGIFPTGVIYTTDLHSLGQYIQEGRRDIFETVINIKNTKSDIIVGYDEDNFDELNYISGKKISYVEKKAMEGTIKAHIDGDVPNLIITIDKLNELTLGHMIYFFEKACAISAGILKVNPFNQPRS